MNFYTIKNIIKFFNEYDLIDLLKKGYDKISNLDKKTFLWIFLALNFVFLFHTISFLWGDHDWLYIQNGVNWDTLLFEGRYSAMFIKTFFLKGQILPIINNVVGFFFYALGVTFLLNYWEAPKKQAQRIINGLIITITPFTLCWLWYTQHTIENLAILFFVVLGLIFSDKAAKSMLYNIAAILLLLIALGIYPSALTCILTVFTAKILLDIVNNKNNSIKDFTNNYKYSLINIILSGIIYKFILILLDKIHLLADMRNIQNAGFSTILSNIPFTMKAILTQLYHYRLTDHNELTVYFLILISLLVIVGIFNAIKSKSFKKIKVYLICLFSILLLLATKTSVILSITPDIVLRLARIDFYGLCLFRGFVVLLLFKYAPILIKNITYIICFLIIWHCVVTGSIRIKAINEGSKIDKIIAAKIIYLIESNKNYNPNRNYNIITIGRYPTPSVPLFLPKGICKDLQYELGDHSLFPQWNPGEVIKYYFYNDNIKKLYMYNNDNLDKHYYRLETQEKLLLKNSYKNLKSFPNQKSVMIVNDYIVICFTQESLDGLKKDIETGEFK